jgi:hypothetical protein
MSEHTKTLLFKRKWHEYLILAAMLFNSVLSGFNDKWTESFLWFAVGFLIWLNQISGHVMHSMSESVDNLLELNNEIMDQNQRLLDALRITGGRTY